MISPVSLNNNVSFGGIVRVKAVFNNGVLSNDDKVIKSAVDRFKKVLLKQDETPNADTVRQIYAKLDPDYIIPAEKVKGGTSSILTTRKSGECRFIMSGPEAEELKSAGKNIGRTDKIVELNTGSDNSDFAMGQNEFARIGYRTLKDEIYYKYFSGQNKPAVILHTATGKRGSVDLIRIGFEPKSVIKEVIPQPKTPPKKGEQTDFMDKLFPPQN